ncbi:acetyltransferase [Photobacterium aquimaris]|uniref:Acyltransferase n=2 Tax=Photobacterium aquimaris TaxID=512643 RepID=A0A2T3ITF9_9GAMM|nr:acetyltransferase [Photobacterium aquimaris]OBU21051.1 acetyltransferase [Photobacterium aquimaris]PSU31647.1 acyltransferase [Photobacterium aquimaris]PSW03352.1 acyltransferase [Photobacterium aquimaris]
MLYLFSFAQCKKWLKNSQHPFPVALFRLISFIRCFELPLPKWCQSTLYSLHQILTTLWCYFINFFYYLPAFKGRLHCYGKRTLLDNGLPFFSGPLVMSIGNDCRISGKTTFSGRTDSTNPTLTIGDNVDIGWQTTIAVGDKIIIGNNVRIASQGFLCGYPGHPIDPHLRAQGLADLPQQIGSIILEDDVWVCTRVTIIGNVTIGSGSIIATGSMVTKSFPPNTLIAGNPAKAIKKLTYHPSSTHSEDTS